MRKSSQGEIGPIIIQIDKHEVYRYHLVRVRRLPDAYEMPKPWNRS